MPTGGQNLGTSTTPATAAGSAATAAASSIVLPISGDTTSSTQRTSQFVSPGTKNIYISLQDSAGHGNATYSYAESINSSTCTPGTTAGTQVCSFTIMLPIGSENISVLATNADNVPLGYATEPVTISAAGTISTGQPGGFSLGGVIASAKATYAFSPFNGGSNEPVVSVTLANIAGDAVGFSHSSSPPYGDPVGSYTVAQTVGQFVPQQEAIHDGTPVTLGPATNTYTPPLSLYRIAFDEVGNGTTAAFSTVFTVTTPQVQYTAVEFPKLPVSTATVAASSSSLTLSCQFASANPTADPCAGAVAVPIRVF